jgi:hypothetical protein
MAMPLLDHFRPPLTPLFTWESFHAVWAGSIMTCLNRLLPPRFVALTQTHLGSQVEADVQEWDQGRSHPEQQSPNGPGGVAVQAWAPPAPPLVVPAIFPDEFEVSVLDTRAGATLVGVVELVSPGNKDRAETRRAFAAKCATYLHRGIGLVVVDVVTERRANLHDALMDLLGHGDETHMPDGSDLYAAAYRPVHRGKKNQIEAWPVALAVGGPLPMLPLALKGAATIPLDLEATYTDARERSRL